MLTVRLRAMRLGDKGELLRKYAAEPKRVDRMGRTTSIVFFPKS